MSKLLATHSLNYMRCFEALFELLIGVGSRLPSSQKNSGSALWLEVAIEEDAFALRSQVPRYLSRSFQTEYDELPCRLRNCSQISTASCGVGLM